MPQFVLSYGTSKKGAAQAADWREFDLAVQEQFSSCLQCLPGIWIVLAETTADDIRDRLDIAMRHSDAHRILVARIGDDVAWKGFTPKVADWLVDRL
jgi:hypothetical protein